MDHAEKIIFVPFIHALGGVEKLILGLSRYLHERKCAHAIVCFDCTVDLRQHADWPVKIRQLKPRRHPMAEARALSRYLRSLDRTKRAQILIFDLNGAFYSGWFPMPRFVLHLTDPPSLLTLDVSKYAPSLRIRGSDGARISKGRGAFRAAHAEVVHRLNRRGVRRAEKVVVMTNTISREVRRNYGVSSQLVRPGVETTGSGLRRDERARHMSATSNEPLRLLSVSRLEPNKRIDWMLRFLAEATWEQASSSPRKTILEIVGDGSQAANLRDLARQLHVEDRVTFHGRVSDERLRTIYAQAHLFLMPAVQGYGLPALEALDAGLPVVLHQDSGVAEILGDTPWAAIVDDRPDSFSRTMQIMLDRLRGEDFAHLTPPTVPTVSQWAEQMCHLCDWTATTLEPTQR